MLWGLHIPIIAVIIQIEKFFFIDRKKFVMYPFEFSYTIRETQF